MARVGGMVSPYVAVALVQACHQMAAILLFAGMVLAAAVAVVLIPHETKGRELTESIMSNKNDIKSNKEVSLQKPTSSNPKAMT